METANSSSGRLGAARFAHLQSIGKTQPMREKQEQRQRPPNLMKNSLAYKQRVEYEAKQIKLRSNRLTWCFICLIGAIFSLLPFLSIHLNQRIGLFVFESDILLLRSSLINVIICLLILSIFILLIIFLNTRTTRDIKTSLHLQRTLRILIGLFAIISIFAYLSLGLIVPQVRQIQRMPLATFDCNANEIVIENCHQQFLTNGEDQTTLEALEQLFLTDIGDKNERLIRQLNCFKYNNRKLETLRAPTRFLLDRCGLVCKPHRQQLHQFSDDLNRDQAKDSLQSSRRLMAPYNPSVEANNSTSNEDHVTAVDDDLVSIKVCFLGDITGGSNYKRFCIENLTNRGDLKSPASYQALTVGQLNAMLRNFTPEQPEEALPVEDESKQQDLEVIEASGTNKVEDKLMEPLRVDKIKISTHADQSTHYVNPIVQFESHFKNWPHLTRTQTIEDESNNQMNYADGAEGRFCKFKPIPPFIVNNKPFSDIQCSLEHEYTINSGASVRSRPSTNQNYAQDNERILLRKSSNSEGKFAFSEHEVLRERCNIQCKVNILYQVHLNGQDDNVASPKNSYYLPLKPCLIVSGDGDKSRTFSYYLIFRSIGDSSLLLCFVTIDLLLLIETIDTRQFLLEGKKFRLVSLMITITFAPLIVAILFDVAALWLPNLVLKSREGYLTSYVNENILPKFNELFNQVRQSIFESNKDDFNKQNLATNSTIESSSNVQVKLGSQFHVDNYLIPFFVYAIFMFALAINIFKLPLVPSTAPLIRTTSTEELGMTKHNDPSKSSDDSIDIEESITNETKKAKKPNFPEQLISRQTIGTTKSTTKQVVIFAMLTLFMGLQFNISQFTQNQVYIESFYNQQISSAQQQQQQQQQHQPQHQSALLFIMATQSIGSLIILTLVLVFSDEMSSFFADFCPFKSINYNDVHERQQEDLNFKKFISISALSYSLRYLVLVNITNSSKLKWPLVIFYQASELLNFPLTWFTLTSRAHQLIGEHFSEFRRDRKLKINVSSQSVAFSGHLIAQSILAFIYFALGRLFALFVHSLHASLHLHSDNVDWFIASFYGENKNLDGMSQRLTRSNSTASLRSPQALFTPLPDERQNYLHASRLFIKYNSLVCFIFGTIFLVAYGFVKYHLWKIELRQKNELAQTKTPTQSDQQSDLIDERLGMDLMQIHSDRITGGQKQRHRQPKLHPPRPKGQINEDQEGQRARILFHYDLGRRRNSSDSSLSDSSKRLSLKQVDKKPEPHSGQEQQNQQQKQQQKQQQQQKDDTIPNDEPEFEVDDGGKVVEQVTTTRMHNKRVRIVEDGEIWPAMNKTEEKVDSSWAPPSNIDDIATSPPPPHSFADKLDEESLEQFEPSSENHIYRQSAETSERNHRRITFAPTTTLMGGNRSINTSMGRSDNRQMEIITRHHHRTTKTSTTTTSIRRASPEPSIGGGEEEESMDRNQLGEADSIEMTNSRWMERAKQYNQTN